MGLPPVGVLAFDVRPCFVWSARGEKIVWSNSAGIRFFGDKSLSGLLERRFEESNPLRLHVARLTKSARGDAPVLERIRFYTGFKSVSTTCLAKRVSAPDGSPLLIMVVTQSFSLNATTSARDTFVKDLAGRNGLAAVFSSNGDVMAASESPRNFRPNAGWFGFLDDISSDYRPKPVELTFGNTRWPGLIVPVGDEVRTDFIFFSDQPVRAYHGMDRTKGREDFGRPLGIRSLDDIERKTERVYIEDIADQLMPGHSPGFDPQEINDVLASKDAEPSKQSPDFDASPDEEASDFSQLPTLGDLERRLRSLKQMVESGYRKTEPKQSSKKESSSQGSERHSDIIDAKTQTSDDNGQNEPQERDRSNITYLNPEKRAERASVSDQNRKSGDIIEVFSSKEQADSTPLDENSDETVPFSDGEFHPPVGKTVRFTWQSNREGAISHVSVGLSEAVGPHAADIAGSTWENLRDALKLDLSGEVMKALKSGDTWTGLRVYWPVEGLDKVAPVDLSALPIKSANGEFEGYRGFGICHMDALQDDPTNRGGDLAPIPLTNGPHIPAPLPVTGPKLKSVETLDPNSEAKGSENAVDGRKERTPIQLTPVGDLSDHEAAALEGAGENTLDDTRDETGEDHEAKSDEEWSSALGTDQNPDSEDENEDADFKAHDPIEPPERAWKSKSGELSRQEQNAFQEIGDLLSPKTVAGLVGKAFHDGQDESDESTANAGPESDSDENEDENEPAGQQAEPFSVPSLEGDSTGSTNVPQEAHDAEPEDRDETLSDSDEALAPTPSDILNEVPTALIVMRNSVVEFANDAAFRLLRAETLLGLKDHVDTHLLTSSKDATSQEPSPDSRLVEVLAADGEPLELIVNSQEIQWSGETAHMLHLTEKPAASESEQNAVPTRELEAILDTATDGILVLDRGGIIQRMNTGAEALFNTDRTDVIGQPLTVFLADGSHRAALDYLDGLLHNGVASILNDGREVTGLTKSGGEIPLFMTMGRVDDGDDGRFCAVLRDITQWKDAQKDLVAARKRAENENSQKSDFVAKISHEIRTPLNAIIGFSEVMKEEQFGPINNDRYREYLRDIHVSGTHIMALINDLLDLAKIEAGKLDLDFQGVSVETILEKCISIMQPQANKDRVIIRCSKLQDIPEVVADERSLSQIMLNLLSNAIKFTPSGGQVIVSSSYEPNGEVAIKVRDTGKGMTEADIKAALEPFRQVHANDGAKVAGTGLGLPLTKALVEANRAKFTIASEPGRGTLVKIAFPNSRVLAS